MVLDRFYFGYAIISVIVTEFHNILVAKAIIAINLGLN